MTVRCNDRKQLRMSDHVKVYMVKPQDDIQHEFVSGIVKYIDEDHMKVHVTKDTQCPFGSRLEVDVPIKSGKGDWEERITIIGRINLGKYTRMDELMGTKSAAKEPKVTVIPPKEEKKRRVKVDLSAQKSKQRPETKTTIIRKRSTIDITTKNFKLFFNGCIKIYTDAMKGVKGKHEKFSFSQGKRFIKVIRGDSVHCFIDRDTGDVLKAASWKAPAKHARGNINDKKHGIEMMEQYGPKHLK